MALEYLRQTTAIGVSEVSGTGAKQTPPRRMSRGKFAMLLSGNLIVWVIFLVLIFDLKVFSADGVSMPKLPQKLAVNGIVYNESSPTVLIGKQACGIGDVVDGYTIIRITPTQVEFEKNGKKLIRQAR